MPAQYEAQSLWHWNKLDIELNGIWGKRALKLLGINETFVFFFLLGGGSGVGEGERVKGGREGVMYSLVKKYFGAEEMVRRREFFRDQ